MSTSSVLLANGLVRVLSPGFLDAYIAQSILSLFILRVVLKFCALAFADSLADLALHGWSTTVFHPR
jgi:hypothetical protein